MSQLTLALEAGGTAQPTETEPWVNADELAGCTDGNGIDLDSVCRVASQLVFILSGRQYGVRTETIRPTDGMEWCVGKHVYGWYDWRTRDNNRSLVLKTPVWSVIRIKLDGVTLTTNDYRLFDNGELIRRVDANGVLLRWPDTQRMDLDSDQPGTFEVTYQWGAEVPEAGKVAARTLACQLVKYMNNDADCALPDRITSITRQGVSQTILDPAQLTQHARTGLYLVDLWLDTVNPGGLKRRPRVASPDTPKRLRARI